MLGKPIIVCLEAAETMEELYSLFLRPPEEANAGSEEAL